ncbi:MAG: lipid A biosynthesis acyltransferase [Proteobacteria bacterium]|nr:lipid A biosynthesis acyltransferase [Pseudomonadota bacterium]
MPARLLAPRYWLTWLGLGLARLVLLLPFRGVLATGRGLGRLARRLPLSFVDVARANIALCLPELDAAGREALLDRHFECLGIGLFESAITWWSDDRFIAAHSTVEGLEHLQAALARGRGAILLTAHFTPLQIGARIMNCRQPICVLYRPTKNELIARVSGGSFARNARKAILRDDVRGMITALKRNEIVWYASDQAYRNKGAEMVPFFGHPAATNVFTPRLAQLTGAAVLYYSVERLPGARGWRAVVHPPFAHWPSGDPVADTLEYHAAIEAQVRRVPDQYWWIHRRFKGLAPDYPDYYAGG